MYQEPCCLAKHLPRMLRENLLKGENGSRSSLFFQSGGDWTVIDLLKAVFCMAGGGILLVCIPKADVELLRYLHTALSRGWCRELLLITREGQEDMVRTHLDSQIEKAHYAVSKKVYDGFLGFYGEENYLSVYGPLLLERDYNIGLYSASFGTDPEIFYSAADAFLPLFRLNSVIKGGGELSAQVLNHKRVM